MAKDLSESVVVVTGASSGIGAAAALAFARKGSKVVLASRDQAALNRVAAACQKVGADTLAIETDTSDEASVQALASITVEHFGRIDVWVNNAAVYELGRFEDLPSAVFRQVIETDFFGYVHGVRAALPHLRRGGSGVIVNVASVFGLMAAPYVSAYAAAKHAVRGFSESLRQELRPEGIDVVTIMPATIDTPLFEHTANYSGRQIKPMSPVYRPERVARAIVRGAARPRPEISVGGAGLALRLLHAVSRRAYDRVTTRMIERHHFSRRPAREDEGNLFQPIGPASLSGGWRHSEPFRWGLVAACGLLAVPAFVGARRFLDR